MQSRYNFDYIYSEEGCNEIKKYIKDFERSEPLQVQEIDRGIVLPRIPASKKNKNTWMGLGGVLDSEGNFVELSGIKHIMEDDFVFGGAYDYEKSIVDYIDKDVVYIGPVFNHWGHFLYEFVTRLWYCYTNEVSQIVYCGWGFEENKFRGSYQRFFELLGIDTEKMMDIRKPTRFRKIFIPEQCYLRNRYFTREYKEMMNIVASNISTEGLVPAEKIYFTRAAFIKNNGWFREHGEQVIQDTFRQNGFRILDPAELSLDEQIFYMQNCKVFGVIASSTGTDSVFMKEGTDRIYIKKGFYMDPDLSQLDQVTNAGSITVIDCWMKPYKKFKSSHSAGPHLIGATDLFLKYLEDNKMKTLERTVYVRSNIKTYVWFVVVSIRNFAFSILYLFYFYTIRNIIKKEQ